MDQKIEEQPHTKKQWAYHLSPRCGAKRKYDGNPCQAPAANGKGRCRLHGGAKNSGAPKNNKNAFKHGLYSKEVQTMKKFIHRLCSCK